MTIKLIKKNQVQNDTKEIHPIPRWSRPIEN